MICRSCGAEISDTIIKCPYCDTENELIAEQEQIAEENAYKEKIKEFASRPDRARNSTQSFFRKHYLKFIIAVIVLILFSTVVTIIAPKIQYRKMQKNIETLEEFYQANDFEAMGEYLSGISDSHKTYYNKYYQELGLEVEIVQPPEDGAVHLYEKFQQIREWEFASRRQTEDYLSEKSEAEKEFYDFKNQIEFDDNTRLFAYLEKQLLSKLS